MPVATVVECSHQDCVDAVDSKDLCTRHYAAMRYRSPTYKTGRKAPCTSCGKPCAVSRKSQPLDRIRCRGCGWAKPKAPKPCGRCGTDIRDKPRSKFCAPCGLARTTERYRDKARKRRATLRGLPSEPYTTEEIAERDEFACGICSLPVDMTLKTPDPGAPSVDHKVPIAAGGGDTLANVQLAHLLCNWRKGDR